VTGQRVALVTGANRGIGRAVATELHRRNLTVVVTARDHETAHATAAEIGPGARPHVVDVTDPTAVMLLQKELEHVDVLVSNAGVLLDAGTDPLTAPLTAVERTLRVNLLGSWRLAQAFVPSMIRRGWGRVVFVSSGTTAEFGGALFAGTPGYSLSKSALNGLTTMLAAQCEGTGVLVNAVNPGRVRTDMMPRAQILPEHAARFIADVATLPDGGPNGGFLTEKR
jgi:NAD(P)-dependent dehydrogenase (short-subunit alcohol dehydrogenase family)